MAPVLSRGIYAPVATFFTSSPDQKLDLPVFESNIQWLATTGLKGIVILGSTGEHVALTNEERRVLTKAARTSLGRDLHLIVGLAPQSLQEAVTLAREAAIDGGDFILVLPPSFWAPSMNSRAIVEFYTTLADQSSLPVIIYSYPGVSSGIDISSDDLAILSKHPNIQGVKQTDHNCGKLSRLGSFAPQNQHVLDSPWMTLAGATDYLLGAHVLGAGGSISGMANIVPRACVEIWELAEAGRYAEAQAIQGIVSWAEWVCAKAGLPGTKAGVAIYRGLEAKSYAPRAPIAASSEAEISWVTERLREAVNLEISLQDKANGPGLRIPRSSDRGKTHQNGTAE